MAVKPIAERAIEQGKGIVRLAPTWVPRSFLVPGRRLKLHPQDYFALGGSRGGIDERWLGSTTTPDNGPQTAPNEGQSAIVFEDGAKTEQVLLRDAIEETHGEVIGDRLWREYRGWPVYSKFFDNKVPLPHHIHHTEEFAKRIRQRGKPEAYYFPPQLNNYGGDFPYTFFGLQPGTTKKQLRAALEAFATGDNRITDLSVAYRLETGTGWDVPPGILHAPGSLCTYEPQCASDVFALYESRAGDLVLAEELLWNGNPAEMKGDYDYLIEMVDWEQNVDPDFARKRFMRPVGVKPEPEMRAEGYVENWICYKSSAFSAKELTVLPGRTVSIKDGGAYGAIVVQGHGSMGVWPIESPALIRFGQLTYDEFFVTEPAARQGVAIHNPSKADPLVMLKHFGPGNPDLDLGAACFSADHRE